MRLPGFILIICLAFSISTYAEGLVTAITAHENGDYQTAYEQFSRLALKDNAEAQYNLAFMYFGGEGVPQNDIKAVFWFEKAAKSGHARAQDTLAYMYLHGRGLDADHTQAYAWYSVAADNGIFLAKNISKNLKKHMGQAERVRAEHLAQEYRKKYKK